MMESMSPKVTDVEVVYDVLIKPRGPLSSSSSVPSQTNLQHLVPLTVFDLVNYNLHVPILYAFQPPMPDFKTLEDALARTLFHYPHLAGSLGIDDVGRSCILLDDTGVRLIATQVPSTLTDNLPFDPSYDVTNLIPPMVGATELFLVQLNRFACGGLVISVALHHRVADGRAMSAFLEAWATTARGNDAQPSLPFHDRASVTAPRTRPQVDFHHDEIEFKMKTSPLLRKSLSSSDPTAYLSGICITTIGVHYSRDFITKLKAKATDGDHSRKFTTFQCMLAHIWKKLTAVRGLSPADYTSVRIDVDGRSRLTTPPVPQSYFGNLVLWAFPRLKAEQLLRMSYAEVAGVIRRAVAAVDEAYFRSFIDFGESMLKRRNDEEGEFVSTIPAAGDVLCPDMECSSWLGLQFDELDFGSGAPCCYFPPCLPAEGLAVLVPSYKDDGGASVFLAVKEEQAQLFQDIAYSLD